MQNTYHSYSSVSHRLSGLGAHLLQAWYRVAAPPAPPEGAPFFVQEVARRGRVTSLAMLITIAMVLLALTLEQRMSTTLTLIVVTCIDSIAVFGFNRRGKITVAGAIITMTTEAGLFFSLLETLYSHHGIIFWTHQLFPLLVQGIIIAASTLPPASVFAVLGINCAVTFAIVSFVPSTPAFWMYLQMHEPQTLGELLLPPFTVFLIVAFISFIWVTSTNGAIKRAYGASARAEYERKMAQREREASDRRIREVQVAVADLTSWLEEASSLGSLPPWQPSTPLLDKIVSHIQRLPLIQTPPGAEGLEDATH